MLDLLKRQAFLFSLVGGVVAIAAAVLVLVYLLYMGPTSGVRGDLQSTRSQAQTLLGGPIFSDSLVEQMKQQVEQRKKQYVELLDYLRELGARRKPLVENLFPTSTEISLRHSFKSAYDARLNEYMERLNATLPMQPESTGRDKEAARAELQDAMEEAAKHTMYAHPVNSFFRPEWVGEQEAPGLSLCRYGQEDIWLMDDLVNILSTMNEEVLQQKQRAEQEKPAGERRPIKAVIQHAPVKELRAIRIGGRYAKLDDVKMQATSGRYRPPEGAGRGERVPTISGRRSDLGFYKVLPWRLGVIVEAKYAGELIRRLRGTESLLSVEAYRMWPITYATFERTTDLLAYSREDYGDEGVVWLQVVGESLIFQLEGGRVTTQDGVGRGESEEAKQPEGAEA
ncbi:MAG: hypothetical protein R6X20_06825 [Phycisphaerae bacterium]